MNIQDALKTGLFLRRALRGTHQGWIDPEVNLLALSKEDLIANDWEVKEKKVAVTYSEILEVFAETLKMVESETRSQGYIFQSFYEKFIKNFPELLRVFFDEKGDISQ